MEAFCSANDGNYVPVCTASQVNCYRRDNLKSLVHFPCHLHKVAGLLLANIANRLYSERQTNKQTNSQTNKQTNKQTNSQTKHATSAAERAALQNHSFVCSHRIAS
jgi:hypothetical protein